MHIALLSPQPFGAYSPLTYHSYVRSLYREPPKAVPPADYTVTVNKKGTPVIRINRKPKFLWAEEVRVIAQALGWTEQRTWTHCLKKKIELRGKPCSLRKPAQPR